MDNIFLVKNGILTETDIINPELDLLQDVKNILSEISDKYEYEVFNVGYQLPLSSILKDDMPNKSGKYIAIEISDIDSRYHEEILSTGLDVRDGYGNRMESLLGNPLPIAEDHRKLINVLLKLNKCFKGKIVDPNNPDIGFTLNLDIFDEDDDESPEMDVLTIGMNFGIVVNQGPAMKQVKEETKIITQEEHIAQNYFETNGIPSRLTPLQVLTLGVQLGMNSK